MEPSAAEANMTACIPQKLFGHPPAITNSGRAPTCASRAPLSSVTLSKMSFNHTNSEVLFLFVEGRVACGALFLTFTLRLGDFTPGTNDNIRDTRRESRCAIVVRFD